MPDHSGKRSARGTIAFLRTEFPLFLGLGSASFFLFASKEFLEAIDHPLLLALIFAWLFVVVLWCAISVVRHADMLAVKCGEPYGTLILTLAAITIEVMMISAAMVHGKNNPTLARDMMYAVIMIALNGLIGISLLLGGLRHREQHYNLQGTNSYLNTIMALSVLGLVLPAYTISRTGPRFSMAQEVFLASAAIALYLTFLFIQTTRHREYFTETGSRSESEHDEHGTHTVFYHVVMLALYLVAVVVLAEKFAIPLDNCIERFGMPQALGGAIVAALVLAPEALSGINAARKNHLQRSVNILHGSVLASIGLTIPAVLVIGLVTHREVALGLEGGTLPLLVLTLGASVVTFTSGKTNMLQGCIHLLLFAVFVLLIFCP